ncbi:hypothetical protein L1049_006776 [Liquidambar formosana]|uniref:Uncharacterized protein n=1 Tax=Liquidambar formosana TaxID=63359 RepID=A0AAP0WRF2_LIQFO
MLFFSFLLSLLYQSIHPQELQNITGQDFQSDAGLADNTTFSSIFLLDLWMGIRPHPRLDQDNEAVIHGADVVEFLRHLSSYGHGGNGNCVHEGVVGKYFVTV